MSKDMVVLGDTQIFLNETCEESFYLRTDGKLDSVKNNRPLLYKVRGYVNRFEVRDFLRRERKLKKLLGTSFIGLSGCSEYDEAAIREAESHSTLEREGPFTTLIGRMKAYEFLQIPKGSYPLKDTMRVPELRGLPPMVLDINKCILTDKEMESLSESLSDSVATEKKQDTEIDKIRKKRKRKDRKRVENV